MVEYLTRGVRQDAHTRSPQALDSFDELISSSIEYGESTSYQLQPAKRVTLNLKELKRILELVNKIRRQQSRKAAGLQP